MQVIRVSTLSEGIEKAKEILYQNINPQTALFLSGGSTPKSLYQILTNEKKLHPGAVGMIDDRFGPPMHEHSNEKMIYDTGFLQYLQSEKILFYSMLPEGLSRQDAAIEYDQDLLTLVCKYPKKVAIMGIGADGHTASIMPSRNDFKNPLFSLKDITLVSSLNDPEGYQARITLTFEGLSLIDMFVILAFGDKKREALLKMFKKGSEEEIPARFYSRKDITDRVTLITDQSLPA